MQPEIFTSILQDNLSVLDTNIKSLLKKSYEMSVVESIKEYGLKQTTAIKQQYNALSNDIQQTFTNSYSDFIKRSDELVKKAIDTASDNYKTICYSNDVFYNDKNLGWGVIKSK